MALYVSGRQPSLSVGIPGITTNAPVLDITGRIGIGTTNPSADIDLNTIRIRQSIFDTNNSSGQLGYFLTNDATGLKWVSVPPDNNNALFISQNNNILGPSSFTGINFVSYGNDLVSISTNTGNTKIVDVRINSYWNKDGNTGIYTSKFVGIGSTTPTVALDVIGNSRISGIVTIGAGNTGVVINSTSGIVTSISGITTLTFYGNLVGSASTASFATTAFNIDATAASKLIVGYASTAGIATNVIGGIASVSSLFVNTTGISTLGTVKISSGIITATSGVVTYYGDGSKLTNIVVSYASTAGIATNAGYATTAGISTYSIKSGVATDVIGGIVSVTSLFVDTTGISTLGTVKISSGIVTATTGIVTFYGNFVGTATSAGYATTAFNLDSNGASTLNVAYAKTAGIATYATNAGVATYATNAGVSTNLKGSVLYSIPYQSGTDTTSFLAPNSGLYLKSNGSGSAPSWDAPLGQVNVSDTASPLTYYPLFVQVPGSTSSVSISQNLFSFIPLSNNPRLGIGTGSPAYNLDVNGKGRFIGTVSADIYYGNGFIGSALSISGIATVSDTFKVGTAITMSAGIVTAITFVGNLTGTASTASFATTAFNLDANGASKLIVAYAQTSGISTNVIGGIASVTSLFVNTAGISTLGTVKISSGIITATTGIITYYGDGQYLENVSGVKVKFQELTGQPVYLTLANSAGVSSIGIVTEGNNALVFIPSNGALGIGTTNPTTKLDVNGDIRLRSGLYDSNNLIGANNSILVSTGSSVVWSSLSQLGGSDITIQVDESTPTPQYLVFTDATSGSTYTEKVSPTKLTYIASSGNLGIGTSIPSTPLSVEKYGVKTGFGTFVASAGITTDIDNFLISDTNFKTAEYTVHIESSISIQAQKVLVMQNGTSAFAQEYGIMYEPTFMISIGATVSGGRCKLQFTPESGISGLMTYRFTRETMK